MATPEEIRKQLEEASKKLSNEIENTSSDLKPKFKEMISNIASVNGSLAKSVADLRKTSKDSFAGALQAQKLASLTSVVDKYLTEGKESLDPKELETLNKNFISAAEGAFDITELKNISGKIEETSSALNEALDEEQAAIDRRSARLAQAEKKQNVLGKMDQRIAELKEKQMNSQGIVLEQITQQLKEEESKRAEKQTAILAGFDREIKEASKKRESLEGILKEEERVRDDYNESLSATLKNSTNFEGLEEFSDGLKELTGFDLVGGLDNVTKKVNAMVTVATTLGKGLAKAALAMKAAIVPMLAAAGAFALSVLTAAGSILLAALPFIGVAALIGLAAYGIYKAGEYLLEKKDEFFEYIAETWESIKIWITELSGKVIGFFTMIGDYFQEKWDEFQTWLGEDSDGILGFIKDIINFVIDYYSAIFQGVTDFFSSVSENGIVESISEIFNMISEKISGMVNKVKGFFGFGDDDEEEKPEEKPEKESFDKLDTKDTSSFDKLDTKDTSSFDKLNEKKPGTTLQKALQPEPDQSEFQMDSFAESQAKLTKSIADQESKIASQGDETPDWQKQMDKDTLEFLKSEQAETEEEYNARRDKREKQFKEQQNRVKAVEQKSLDVKNKTVEDESKYRKFTDEQLAERAKKLDEAESKALEMKANARDENELARAEANLEQIANRRKADEADRLKPMKGQEIDIQPGPRAKMSGENIALASTEAVEAKESKMTSNSSIQNVVGGTTVNNASTTKIMGRPSVWDDDRTLARVNSSEW